MRERTGDPGKSIVEERARSILQYLLKHRGRRYTHAQLRTILAIPDRRQFSEALTLARKLAHQGDEEITYCFLDRDKGEQVFCLGPSDDAYLASISTRGGAITGQIVNFTDHLEWGSRNAGSPLIRKLSLRAAQANAAAVQMSAAFTGMAQDLFEALAEDRAA